MVTELNLEIDIVGCPIIREESGLAMSSRNILLSLTEKEDALIINQTLNYLQKEIKAGKISTLLESCRKKLNSKSELEYLTVADLTTLEPKEQLEKGKEYRAFVVSRVGNVRLIDNIEIFV